ncbi:MAG TPA: hypothetical protein VIK14_06940 [Ignavibacteria bacterium]
MEYDKSIIETHPLFIKNRELITKYGIKSFLRDIGIFFEIIPLVKPPNEKGECILIGFNIEFEYRSYEMRDEKHYKMEQVEDYTTYETKELAGTNLILKSFKIIENNKYFQNRIDEISK